MVVFPRPTKNMTEQITRLYQNYLNCNVIKIVPRGNTSFLSLLCLSGKSIKINLSKNKHQIDKTFSTKTKPLK